MLKRSKYILLTIGMLATLAFATSAQAGLIDFEDGTSGNPVGSFYAAQGVEFSNAEWTDIGLEGMSGTFGIRAIGTFQWFEDNPLVITFPNGTSGASMLGVDVGLNGLRMAAYDALSGGNLIDSDEAFGDDVGVGQNFTVQTEGTLIYRIELYQVVNVAGDGIVLDDLQFDIEPPTPVPTLSFWTLMLLTLLMATFGFFGLRARKN